jgi:dCMP deaminase
MNSVHEHYLSCSYWVATKSNDPRTQIGAVLVSNSYVLMAHNTTTPNISISRVTENPNEKYYFMEHAERVVIYKAAKYGWPTRGATLYSFWSACSDCARAIVLAGITTVYRHKELNDKTTSRWSESTKIGDEILISGGVRVIDYEGKLNAPSILFDSEIWEP